MNSITRLLAVTGIGVAAGVAIGAGPAQAASSTGHDAAVRTAVSGTANWNDDSDVIGYFNSPIRCERVGRLGEIRDRWDDYDCYRVRYGFHRGDWALEVSSDRWGGGFRPDCPRPGGFDGGFGGGFDNHGDGGFGPGFHGRRSA